MQQQLMALSQQLIYQAPSIQQTSTTNKITMEPKVFNEATKTMGGAQNM
jgi:hypothetical protein